MKDLSRRLAVSSFSIVILVCLIVFAFSPWFQFFVAATVAALTAVAIWEYAQLAIAKGRQVFIPALIAFSVLEVLSFFIAAKVYSLSSLPLIVFVIAFFFFFAIHFSKREGALVDLAVSFFGLIYIAVPMGMILGIIYLIGQDGRWWIAYLLTVTKITDIGAYFAGSLWGRRKLAPTISPSKTIEGAIFGLICAVAASYAFHILSGYLGAVRFHLGTFEWVFLGLVLGLTGQFGDLSESLLKRDAKKKDSNALPGLGGVLDSVDSLLFNVPILYIYLHFLKL